MSEKVRAGAARQAKRETRLAPLFQYPGADDIAPRREGHPMHRLPKADWPLRILAAAGGTALFALLQLHAARRGADVRDLRDGRIAASALLAGALLPLLVNAVGRWLDSARRMAEKRQDIRLATLMKHADPVYARQDEHEREMADLRTGQRATAMKVDTLMATFAEVLDGHGDAGQALAKTEPMLRLVKGSKDERDSA